MDFLTKHWFNIFCNQFIELINGILYIYLKDFTDSELSTQNITLNSKLSRLTGNVGSKPNSSNKVIHRGAKIIINVEFDTVNVTHSTTFKKNLEI